MSYFCPSLYVGHNLFKGSAIFALQCVQHRTEYHDKEIEYYVHAQEWCIFHIRNSISDLIRLEDGLAK